MVKRSASDAARLLVGMRKRDKRTCPICGVIFDGLKGQEYYPPKCQRTAAQRRRRRRLRELADG